MQRYFIYFCYDGTRYHGWQIQPNGDTVQEVLQLALATILRREITLTGAGRTDTGVHARQMVAHWDSETILDIGQLAYRLNRILPHDIGVDRIEPVDSDMHARFSAKKRCYHYYIHTSKNPFLYSYSCELHYTLDFDAMNEAATYLLHVDDFGAFCKSHADVKTTLCKVTEAKWVQTNQNEWYFSICANRFLRNMVRAIVGTLIEVGRHRLSICDFKEVVDSRKRTEAGESMPAKALFLEQIGY